MRNFYTKIVNHSKQVIVIYVVLFVVCLVCSNFVSVNYDMSEYLPDDSASTVALEVMEEEYGTSTPNMRAMIYDVSISEALEYKEAIEAVEGVSDVTWLDDVVSIEEPLSMQDTDTVETYYKDGTALFSITVEDEYILTAVNEIDEIVGDDNAITGDAVSTAIATESTVREIIKVALFAIPFAIIVLFFTTTSWIEPFLILLVLCIAVVINAGTHIIFGEISFVTNAAGSILQLAVSLDYAVFILHRFEECRMYISDPKEAMVEALVQSTSSVLSSGLTTVIGFLALCIMQYKIGADLGLALAKGVALSLITAFTLLPVLTLKIYPQIEKRRHRKLLPNFDKFAAVVRKVTVPLVVVFCILIIPCYLASTASDFYFGSSDLFGMETEYGQETAAVEEMFGQSDTYVLMVSKESTATQKALSDELHEIEEVTSIISYVDTVGTVIPETYLDEGTLSQLNSENYTRMVITLDTAYEGDETFALVEEIRALAEKYYPGEWYLAGEGVSTYDLMDTITSDMIKVNLVAIIAVFIVLLLSMKSLILPVILVLVIETAIWINLSIPYFAGDHVFYIAYLIINSIQLGATVDYAILFTNRYMEFRSVEGKEDAVKDTISAVFASIMTSGIVLSVAGFALSIFSTHGLIAQLGTFLGVGTLCSLAAVIFVLPGMLYLFDGLIQKTTRGVHFKNTSGEEL